MEIKYLNYKRELIDFSYDFDYKKIYGILGNASTLFELIKGLKKPVSGQIEKKRSFILYDSGLNAIDKSLFLDEEIKKISKKLGIDDKFLDKDFDYLTDSEKAKVNYIVMKAYNPEVIMFDNYFENLDFETKKIIINDLKKMEFDELKTIIIASNNVDFIFEVCDEIIVLTNEILLSGNKFDVFENVDLITNLNFDIPSYISFSNYVNLTKGIKLPYRDRVSDIAKDVYDNV